MRGYTSPPDQQALTRRWNAGATELIVWTTLNLALLLPILIVWVGNTSVLSSAFRVQIDNCTGISQTLSSTLAAFIFVTFLSNIADFVVQWIILTFACIAHCDSSLDFRLPISLAGLASIITIVRLILTIVGTAAIALVLHQCSNRSLQLMTVVLIISGWSSLLVNTLCLSLTYRRASARSVEDWVQICRCITCHICWRKHKRRDHQLELDGFNSVAIHLKHVLHDIPDMTISDVYYALTLVRALQIARKRRGHTFTTIDETQDDDAPESMPSSPDQSSKESISIPLKANQQPNMTRSDWSRLEEMKYYTKYSVGAYGAPLYAMMRPWAICCLPNCFQVNRDNIHTTGGCGCFCSVRAFLLRTGRSADDIIYANLNSQAGCAVFYVCADHAKRQMVVAIRGTHSLQDLLSDFMMDLKPLDDYSIPGSLVHAGVLAAASNVLVDLQSSPAVTLFLDAHRDYGVVLTGHSLGSAIASIVTLLTVKDPSLGPWPNRPVHCYGLATLPMMDFALADSVESRRHITTGVFRNDLVSRLSVFSVKRLKFQMLGVMRASSPGEVTDPPGRPERRLHRHPSRWATYRSLGNPARAGLDFVHQLADSPEFFAWIDKQLEPSAGQRLYVPGRVFHLVDTKDKPAGCGRAPTRSTLAYPADRRALDEILVSKSMMVQHFPQTYLAALDRLPIAPAPGGRAGPGAPAIESAAADGQVRVDVFGRADRPLDPIQP